jgi:hypothetical protein
MAIADTIRDVLRAAPFQPFTLGLADGTQHEITGREWLSIPPTGRVREALLYIPFPDDPDRFQHRWIDLGLITEVIVPSAMERGRTTNGPQ